MSNISIAVIKDNLVVDNIIIDDSLLDNEAETTALQNALGCDVLYNAGFTAALGSIYYPETNTLSKPPKPHDTWVWTEFNRWEPPVPYPTEPGLFHWNEELQSWIPDAGNALI